MKKVKFESLVPGSEYYVECGIWSGFVIFVGAFPDGKRIKFRFTFGNIENWRNQFNIFSTKSNLKVMEKEARIRLIPSRSMADWSISTIIAPNRLSGLSRL